MASDPSFVEFVCDQVRDAGTISSKKMFGEYAVYCDGKVVALICDDQLFVKQTTAGRALLPEVVEAPPYPGAKNSFLIGDEIDDRDLMVKLIRATADELPQPRPKKPRRQKGSS